MAISFTLNPFTGNFDAIDQVTLANVGSSPNAQGASITSPAQVLTLQPADGSNPGLLTAIAQTIGGVKTFSSAPNFSSLTASQALVLDASKNVASYPYSVLATGNTLVQRDGNGNTIINNLVELGTNVVSAGSTTPMSAASTQSQILTGTSNQTFTLPDTTTLAVGAIYTFNNNSTGNLTVNDH